MPSGRANRLVVIVCALVALWPRGAQAIAGNRRGLFGLDGSLRTITAVTDNYTNPLLFGPGHTSDGYGELILRLVAGGYPTKWLSYEAHAVESLDMSTAAASGFSLVSVAPGGLRYRAVDTRWTQVQHAAIARFSLDRFSVKLSPSFADITIGRQAITFGKAYFWNPLDVFRPFEAFQFDRDYKGGVDALRIDIPIGAFSGINVVGVLGHGRASVLWYHSALLVRGFTTVGDWDLAAQGGKIWGGYHAGAAVSGELGPVEVHAEGQYFWASTRPAGGAAAALPDLPSYASAVAGAGHRFANSLQLEGEYLYNGAGTLPRASAFELVLAGLILQTSEHAAGLVASYDFTGLLHGSLAYIVSLSDGSMLIQPGITYSAGDEVDLVAGALVAVGKRPQLFQMHSEFGTYPNFFYTEAKIYF